MYLEFVIISTINSPSPGVISSNTICPRVISSGRLRRALMNDFITCRTYADACKALSELDPSWDTKVDDDANAEQGEEASEEEDAEVIAT